MFRPIRRQAKEIRIEAAKELLKNERRAVLAVNGDDGYPYAIPVNFYYNEETNKIYFHGAAAGHKADALRADDKDVEWAPYVQSAVAFGRCRPVRDREEVMTLVRQIAKKYYPNDALIDEEIAHSGRVVQVYEITIEHLSGKEIQER